MSILRMAANFLAVLWLERKDKYSACESWLFNKDEVIYKYGVRVTVELLPKENVEEWLATRGNVSVTEPV